MTSRGIHSKVQSFSSLLFDNDFDTGLSQNKKTLTFDRHLSDLNYSSFKFNNMSDALDSSSLLERPKLGDVTTESEMKALDDVTTESEPHTSERRSALAPAQKPTRRAHDFSDEASRKKRFKIHHKRHDTDLDQHANPHEVLTGDLEKIIGNAGTKICPWFTICTKHKMSDGKYEEKQFFFGKYLGKGSFGKVWKLQPDSPERCIKLVMTRQRNHLLNVNKEMLSNKRHLLVSSNEFIVTLYEYGTIHSTLPSEDAKKIYSAYSVMETCQGGEMFDLIASGKYNTYERLNRTTSNLLSALIALERVGLVHCDLKPSNIAIASAEDVTSVRLIDFGGCTKEGSLAGAMTQRFASPEQQYTPVSCKSDVYTLGLILAVTLCCGIQMNPNPRAMNSWFNHPEQTKSYQSRVAFATSVVKSNISPMLRAMLEVDVTKRSKASQLKGLQLISQQKFDYYCKVVC